ncbi:imidazole glycerol phosphate synthase subunit HisF [Aliivibrio kagoshimensis]|uniref:imidazole glycerol phosphate synthase subunit HisF n=1 Tax=Aliivibrio kagoshimensis TaxID=2910230 RepID=UPI003D0CE913
MKTRIIVKLDVKPPYVVKPVHFEGLRKIGFPNVIAEDYYSQGADEIFYIDIVASLYQREILPDPIMETARNLYVPFAVGGGVKSISDCKLLFNSGADKVVINTYVAQSNPQLITEAAEIFGSQAVCVSIEAKRINSIWMCLTDCGRISSGRNVYDWIQEVEELGAGEILLQSVDCDGRQRGFDLELAKGVVNSVNIPVVVASGAGSLKDIGDLVLYAQPSGVAISSILHYKQCTVQDIKTYLNDLNMES